MDMQYGFSFDPGSALGMFGDGGVFGGSGNKQRRKVARDNYRYAARYQPDIIQANTAAQIRGKLQAAQEGGLHPLFALGSAGGGSSPSFSIPGQSPTGSFSDLGVGIQAASVPKAPKHQQKIDEQQLRLLTIQADTAQLALDNMKNKPAAPDPNAPIKVGVERVPSVEANKGRVELEADKERTRDKDDSSRSAAINPAWMQVEIFPGITIDMLWSEEGPAESMDSLPAVAITLARNMGMGYVKAYKLAEQMHHDYFTTKAYGMRSRHPAAYHLRNIPRPGSRRSKTYAGPQPYRTKSLRY